MTYVLTLKTWAEYDRAHHWYGRIHWQDECGIGHAADSENLPDPNDHNFTTIRHNDKQSAIDGAVRWFELNGKPGSKLVLGVWMFEWVEEEPYEILATR